MKGIGAAVMGRITYGIAVSGALGPLPPTNYPTYILTHRPMPNPPARCESFSDKPGELVERLRAQLAGSGKDIWHMGGGESIEAFRAEGLIDRLELRVIPTLLGDGIPLFPLRASGEQQWRLVKNRAFKNGVVAVWHEPQPSSQH